MNCLSFFRFLPITFRLKNHESAIVNIQKSRQFSSPALYIDFYKSGYIVSCQPQRLIQSLRIFTSSSRKTGLSAAAALY